MILHFEVRLLGCKICLVILLSLYRSRHVNITTILANIGIPDKLRVQPLRTHVPFYSINNLNDILNILFKLLSNL